MYTMISELESDPDVEYADPVGQLDLALEPCEECDPDWEQQWGFYDEWGQAHIHMPQAWDVTTGQNLTLGEDRVVSAVSDNGFQFNHVDLLENIWCNVEERQGDVGVDDDGNGRTDDVYGMAYDPDPTGVPIESENIFHGTHVTGTVSAVGNNEYHVAGVNWNAQTMVIKGCCTTTAMLQSYLYALDMRRLYNSSGGAQGAYIVSINSSYGWPHECEQATNSIIRQLRLAGVLSVIAAHNSNANIDDLNWSPAACLDHGTVVVAASSFNDTRAVFEGGAAGASNWGPIMVDLAAPGINIISTIPEDISGISSGTSMAAPMVSGAIALIHTIPNPSFYEYYQNPGTRSEATLAVKDMIRDEVDIVPGFVDTVYSGGRLNVASSVQAMCNFYHDNGHDMVALTRQATLPASVASYARAETTEDEYEFATFQDGNDAMYAWKEVSAEDWYIYRLTTDNAAGDMPTVAAKSIQGGVRSYLAWRGGRKGIKVLQHTIDNLGNQQWRLANLGGPNLQPEEITAPVFALHEDKPPAVIVGADNGVHIWWAQDEDWYDIETWVHDIVDQSENDDVTSVTAVWAPGAFGSEIGLHILWIEDFSVVKHNRGMFVETTGSIGWIAGALHTLSADITTGSGFKNITFCGGWNFGGEFAAWEGTDNVSGRQSIYVAQARSTTHQWSAEELDGFNECLNRRAPSLHVYAEDQSAIIPTRKCRVGLAYERQYEDESVALIVCRGLRIDENNPNSTNDWIWLPPETSTSGKESNHCRVA